MKKILLTIFVLSSCFWVNSFVYSKNLDVKTLLEKADTFDGTIVEIEGEVIGEILKAPDGYWVNVSSFSYPIGVFSQHKEVFEEISHWGGYGQAGDIVKIEGVFNRECSEHQVGDIHLKKIEIIEEGYGKDISAPQEKIKMAVIAFIICLTTALIYLIKVKYGKRT